MNIPPRVLLFRGHGIVSGLIRFQTRSEFTHAAILMPDGDIVEAWQGKGVRVTRLDSYKGVSAFDVEGVTPEQWERVIEFCLAQVGKGYDYQCVAQFITRRRASLSSQERWFCSELVFAAFLSIGVVLLDRVSPANVSPRDLSISPKLII